MTTTSLIAEAVRNEEAIHQTRERAGSAAHVERNYRQIALPALAGVTRRIAARRRAANAATSDIALRLAETGA
jgi:hypothetical protein